MTSFIKQILYGIVGILAGVISWVIIEYFIGVQNRLSMYVLVTIIEGIITGAIFGMFLGTVEGIAVSSRYKVFQGARMGLFIGAVAGFLSFLLIQGIVFFVISSEFFTLEATSQKIIPVVRLIGITLLGAALGGIEGIRSRSGRKFSIGILGGALGGILGGLAFFFLIFQNTTLIRLLGFVLIGGGIGTCYSILERRHSYGKVKVLNGVKKNKEYLLVKKVSSIGTSKDCDIVLDGYDGIGFHHGNIEWRHGDLYLVPIDDKGVTVINDVPTTEQPLKYEDVLQLGAAKLFFLP